MSVAPSALKSMMAPERSDLIRPIAHLRGAKPPAPAWFERAVAAASEEAAIEVGGAEIRYSAWGERGKRGLIFIHGGRAHRNWWRPFAPAFSAQYRVAAYDMSGNGDSDWRTNYSLDLAVDELFAVIDASGAGEGGRPIVIGHSFGGWVTLAAVERQGERLLGAVVIDSPIGKPDPDEGYTILRKQNSANPVKANKVYAAIEEPIARFRFLPNQPSTEHYLVDYIAREGLRKAALPDGGAGWTWKFDPGHGRNFEIHYDRDLFLAARCPLAFLYGELSAFAIGDGFDHLKAQARGRSPLIVIPDAHHHLMMEHPIAFISALRTLLTCWPVRVGN
jgi:pimeloyl-ACP methyl ester carboxylesterase